MKSLLLIIILFFSFPFAVYGSDLMVIPPGAEPLLRNALHLNTPLPGTVKWESLEIKGESAKLCYTLDGNQQWCAELNHPDASKEGTVSGAFRIVETTTSKPVLIKELARRLAETKEASFWHSVSKPNEGVRELSEAEIKAEPVFRKLIGALDADNIDDARKLLKNLESINAPESLQVIAKARIASQTGKLEESQKLLSNVKAMPGYEQMLVVERARMLILSGRYKEGIELLSAHQEKRENYCPVYDIAAWLVKNKRDDEAFALEKTVRNTPVSCDNLIHGLASQYLARGDCDSLMELADDFLKKKPRDSMMLIAKATALRRQGKPKEALPLVEAAYRESKDITYLTLHSTIASSPMWGTWFVLRKFKNRLEESPDDLLLMHAVAVMSYYSGDYETAKKYMDKLRPQIPNEARVYIYGAMSRYELGDWAGAVKWLDDLEASKARPDSDLHYCRAVLWHRKDPKRALKELDLYLSEPEHIDDFKPKRKRAIEFRQLLVEGKEIPDWLPKIESPE